MNIIICTCILFCVLSNIFLQQRQISALREEAQTKSKEMSAIQTTLQKREASIQKLQQQINILSRRPDRTAGNKRVTILTISPSLLSN